LIVVSTRAAAYPLLIVTCRRYMSVLVLACLAAFAAPASADAFVVSGTLEAAAGQPRIHTRLIYQGNVLTALSQLAGLDLGLEDLLGGDGIERSFMAYFDTGAGAYVLSQSTAGRFGLPIANNTVYHEVGLKGETPMSVSMPVSIAIADSSGMIDDQPTGAFHVVERDGRAMINRSNPMAADADPQMAQLIGALMEINVVGMPAIEQFVVEIDPAPMEGGLDALDPNTDALALLENLDNLGVGPAVRLHPPNHPRPGVDIVIDLNYVDFNRYRNPSDRGAKPTLARNPMIERIVTHRGNAQHRGSWLLDTGAAVSIISVAQARQLGLVSAAGEPIVDRQFTLPITGISGGATQADGFVLDRLVVPVRGGNEIVYRNAHVIVHDISIVLDDGSAVTLDGVFGLNLLLPTISGMATGLPTGVAPGPYKNIWIDGPGATLELETD
jgi:hypothetical protein